MSSMHPDTKPKYGRGLNKLYSTRIANVFNLHIQAVPECREIETTVFSYLPFPGVGLTTKRGDFLKLIGTSVLVLVVLNVRCGKNLGWGVTT